MEYKTMNHPSSLPPPPPIPPTPGREREKARQTIVSDWRKRISYLMSFYRTDGVTAVRPNAAVSLCAFRMFVFSQAVTERES